MYTEPVDAATFAFIPTMKDLSPSTTRSINTISYIRTAFTTSESVSMDTNEKIMSTTQQATPPSDEGGIINTNR